MLSVYNCFLATVGDVAGHLAAVAKPTGADDVTNPTIQLATLLHAAISRCLLLFIYYRIGN